MSSRTMCPDAWTFSLRLRASWTISSAMRSCISAWCRISSSTSRSSLTVLSPVFLWRAVELLSVLTAMQTSLNCDYLAQYIPLMPMWFNRRVASAVWTEFATSSRRLLINSAVLGKILFSCIFDTDTDTSLQMYLRYRYKILDFKCIKDTDTTKKYLDTRFIEDGYSLICMFKCYFFNIMLPSSSH